ncbi:MAG TPA: hypothetical protein VHX86_11300 [Tepidisphaeraceae bacterium]|nr:hypothetical protein [Tepidisphaeraceae bacterium]
MAEDTEALAAAPAMAAIVVAKPGRYYRVARYLMTLLLMTYGAWSIYDGFVSWPHWADTHPAEKPKTATDIMLNKVLGVILPPGGLFILIWALYSSRGQYRLENGILHVPGSPPVPLEKIHSVNREAWDRKGIAYVEYDLSDPPQRGSYGQSTKAARGSFKIDDFVYEREPTDQIFKAIEDSLLKGHEVKPPVTPPVAAIPPRPARSLSEAKGAVGKVRDQKSE